MLTPLLYTCLAVFSHQTPLTASGLVSKMFARYASAKSVFGTVETTQVAAGATVKTLTEFAYERPSKIRLNQRQTSASKTRARFIVSNGEQFAYSPPEKILNSAPFLMETVVAHGVAQTVGELYAVVATDLPDRSPILDALVGRPDDLGYFATQLAQFRLSGREKIGDRETNRIDGDWREDSIHPVGGKFQLYITDAGDVVRYVLIQAFAAPSSVVGGKVIPGGDPVTVTTTWDASIVVNDAIKPETFALKAP